MKGGDCRLGGWTRGYTQVAHKHDKEEYIAVRYIVSTSTQLLERLVVRSVERGRCEGCFEGSSSDVGRAQPSRIGRREDPSDVQTAALTTS